MNHIDLHSLEFASVTLSDLDQIGALQPKVWTGMARKFGEYVQQDFSHPIKVILGDKIIGVGASNTFWPSAWIAHIVVHPDYRKQGIGSRIVQALLDDLRARSVQSFSLLSTENGESVYRRFGFRPIATYLFFQRTEDWPNPSPDPHIQSITDGDFRDIQILDWLVTGEKRGILLANHLEGGFVYRKGKRFLGYYLPNLMEGAIYALTQEAGLALMAKKYATADKAVIPADNQPARDFLLEAGFTELELKEKRMELGEPISWRPQHVFSRVGGNYG